MGFRCLLFSLTNIRFGRILPLSLSADGETIVYRFSTGTLLLPVIAAVLFIALAWLSPKLGIPDKYRWQLIIFSIIAGVIFAPMMYFDRVIVSPTEIVQKTGFWFMPTVKGFQYDDVQRVHVVRRKGVKSNSTIWKVTYLDGTVEDIYLGDLWKSNTNTIVPRLQSYGVVIISDDPLEASLESDTWLK